MSTDVERAIEKLREQQGKVKEESPQWMVAEQLMEICRREPESAVLIAQDLDNPEMSIVHAEAQIKAWADKNRVGNFACVTPLRAERILRSFYGLTERAPEVRKREESAGGLGLSLSDFLG